MIKPKDAIGGCLQRRVRHILVIEELHGEKWQRSDLWRQKASRELADWEWRLLLNLNNLSPERRAEIAISVAEEWIRGSMKKLSLPDELKEQTIAEIIKQARMDNVPNNGCLQGIVGRPSEHLNLYEIHAREKAGMPQEWELYTYKSMPPGGQETHYMELTGAVCPKVTKGKRSGRPNYAKKDKTTVRVVYITPKEHDDWMAAWEKKTGMCSRCTGTGEVLQSVSVKDGAKYRQCPKCKGARTPNVVELNRVQK